MSGACPLAENNAEDDDQIMLNNAASLNSTQTNTPEGRQGIVLSRYVYARIPGTPMRYQGAPSGVNRAALRVEH